MDQKKFTTKTLKAIFTKAKLLRERGELTWNLNEDFKNQIWGAISEVGRERLYELKDEIYPYIEETAEPFFKEQAIMTLGSTSRLHLPEFKEKAYDIWLHDSYGDAKECALKIWTEYYEDCQDKETLLRITPILYKIISSNDYGVRVRVDALRGLIQIADFREAGETFQLYFTLAKLPSHEALEEKIEWERVYKIVRQYAPDALETDVNKKFQYLKSRQAKRIAVEKKRINNLNIYFEKEKLTPTARNTADYYDLDEDVLRHAIRDVGMKEFIELKDKIYDYLNHDDPILRYEAVATLGSVKRLQLPEFRNKAYEIWLKDIDEDVKNIALQSWAGYARECQDKITLRKVLFVLYKILNSHHHTIQQRVIAFVGIIESGKILDKKKYNSLFNLVNFISHEVLDKKIDWERINKIMREYAPDALREYPKI